MRWRKKRKLFRIRKRFLFFPKTINGETRWLEWAYVQKRYISVDDNYGFWRKDKFRDDLIEKDVW